MTFTLVAETGSGVSGANSYATVANADTYFEGQIYKESWREHQFNNYPYADRSFIDESKIVFPLMPVTAVELLINKPSKVYNSNSKL